MKNFLSLVILAVFSLSVLTACQSASTANQSASTANKAANNSNKSAPKTDEHGHADDAPRISLADAKKDFDAGSVIFVDTRAEASYKNEHIKGSINIPAETVETRYKEIPTDKKIIAYCSWPSEQTSAGLVAKLKEKGIGNAYALVGGTNAWTSAGYPMEKAEEIKK